MGVTTSEKPIVCVQTEKIGSTKVDVFYNINLTSSFPPVLMVHGMFGGGWYFGDWANFLCEKGVRVYVIKDLHFECDVRKVEFSDYVNKTMSVIKSLIGDMANKGYSEFKRKPIIFGHSMGGLIAQKITEEYHPWINGIVLVDSAPPRGIPIMSWGVAKAMAKHWFSLIFNRPLEIDKKSAFDLLFNWLGNEERKEQIFQKLVPESPIVAKQLAFGKISVGDIQCKSLVVAGVYDRLLPLQSQIAIAEKYNSEYLSFLTGHMIPLEDQRLEIIDSIYRWIEREFKG